jgi:putative transposase
MAGEGLPVQMACRVLGVSESGYSAWRKRAPSARAIRHAWLTDLIREVHLASRDPGQGSKAGYEWRRRQWN